MTNETIIDAATQATASPQPGARETAVTPAWRRIPRRTWVVGALAAPLALGAVGLSLARGSDVPLTLVAPTAIAAIADSGSVAAKGEVAEIFGNKFVVQDGTGRALVETGRDGEGGRLVSKSETVTVQGRFENGFLHARLLTHADGNKVVLGPAGGPPRGTLDWAKDKAGLEPKPDVGALTASVQAAGYTDVRITGRGPRHWDVAARGQDGREHLLHVGFDGQVRDRRVF
ncbi:DNA-binding protein [uncultured Methylobacterium sp.]|uniref:DNA-binding protein n=1 Tax=uncultured Methylobacterium sp. TaxID=157278 RepID=UPI0035C952E4